MPWKVERQDGKHCVVNSETGETKKCYPDASSANRYLRALWATGHVERGMLQHLAFDALDEELVDKSGDLDGYALVRRSLDDVCVWDLYVAGVGCFTTLDNPFGSEEGRPVVYRRRREYAIDLPFAFQQGVGFFQVRKGPAEVEVDGDLLIIKAQGQDPVGIQRKEGRLCVARVEKGTSENEANSPGTVTIAKHLLKALLRQDKAIPAVWKSADGSMWYMAVISTAVVDREKEIVEREGIDYAIALAQKHGYHSGLYIAHSVPHTKIGQSVHEFRVGPFWVEIGKFTDGYWLAEKVFKRLTDSAVAKLWRLSIGFLTTMPQIKKGRYKRLLKYDTSLTDLPANPWTVITPFSLLGGQKDMNDVEKILELLSPEGDDEAAGLREMLENLFKEKEISSVTKEENETVTGLTALAERLEGADKELVEDALALLKQAEEEEETEEEEPEEEEEEAPAAEKMLAEVNASLAALKDEIVKIGSRVKAIEDDTSASEALAAVVKRLPLSTLQRPSAGAQQLGNEVVDDLVDRLLAGIREKNQRQGDLHPFAGFAGGPSGIEGGIQ